MFHQNTVKTIGQGKDAGELRITLFQRDMGWGIDTGINVKFPDFMSEERYRANRKEIDKIAKYCSNKFHYRMISQGKYLLEEMQENGYPLPDPKHSMIYLEYGKGKSAMIRTFIYSKNSRDSYKEMKVEPFLTLDSASSTGLTVTPGHYSDLIITENYGKMMGYTKDFSMFQLGLVSLYLEYFVKKVWEVIIENKFPEDYEEYSSYRYLWENELAVDTLKQIKDFLIEKMLVNQSKRIDSLEVNGKTLETLMLEHDIKYSISINGSTLVRLGIELGKTPYQINSKIEKILACRRAATT